MIPGSGLTLKTVGTARRIVREVGKKFILWIPIVYSENDGKYHRVLPQFLKKFMQYTVITVLNAVNDNDDLDQYDGPSDPTISRWKKKLRELLRKRLTASGSLPKKYHFTYEQLLFLFDLCSGQTTLIMDRALFSI